MAKRVLVVDDSLTIRQMVGAVLEADGFDTIEAMDGRDALEKLSMYPDIALVMCDVNMPNMNGLDFVAHARELGSKVPFLMLTTEGQPDLMDRARRLGVAGWIVKPVKPGPLAAAVKSLIGTSVVPPPAR
jgi:two-component system, chemotaxis family, chemotaxis protein CheY